MILVPETTSVPTSTDEPESTRSGLTTSVNAIAPTTTRATLAGIATRRKRICWLWRTAARKTRSASARPKRATLRGPSSLASDSPVREVIPRAPNPPDDGPAVPARCEPLWGSMLVPKYGPAAAGTPQNRAEKTPEQGLSRSYPREVTQFPTIHTGVGAGRDIVSHGTVIRSNTFSAARASSENLPFRSRGLEHDPEKCAAVFGKDHAQTKS